MKKLGIGIIYLLFTFLLNGQAPLDAPLPEKFDNLKEIILVDNFPNPLKASKDPDDSDSYYWKHNTTLLSTNENITIEEGGAYLFYNKRWNLRVAYKPKQFSKFFHIPKKRMKKGEPYTFVKNWRKDATLYGGWAMWYVIGTTDSGERVFGVGRLDTVGELY